VPNQKRAGVGIEKKENLARGPVVTPHFSASISADEGWRAKNDL
jgi:hypothetical protein